MIQQPKQDDDIDKKLLELAQKFQAQINDYLKRAKQGLKVLLLVGNTGAGKSTIFNILAGANFGFAKDSDDQEVLEITNMNEQYSAMNDGVHAVTKEPKYYFNDEKNHLLIDFPGFLDTEGALDQLMIQMLFLKIVTYSPTKIVYVIKQSDRSLPDRGVSLQTFIKEQFQKQNLDSSKFTLLLNSYNDKLSEENLIKKVKQDLSKIYPVENIIVLRKVDDEASLQQHFSKERRDNLWKELINANQIEFSPQILPCSEIVSTYVRKQTSYFIRKYFDLFDQTLLEKDSDLSQGILNQLIVLIQQLSDIVITIDKNQIIAAYSQFMLKFKEIITFLARREPQLLIESKGFMDVFEFYSQFSNFIEGYQECFQELINSKDKCEFIKQTVNIKLQQIKEQKEKEEKIRKEQEEYAETKKTLALEQERMKYLEEMQQLKIKHLEEQNQKNLELEREKYQRQLDQYWYENQQSTYQISYQNSQIQDLNKKLRQSKTNSKKSNTTTKKSTTSAKKSTTTTKKSTTATRNTRNR